MATSHNRVNLCTEHVRSIIYSQEVSDIDAHGRRKLGGALRACKSEMRKLHHLQDQTFWIFIWPGKWAKSCPLQPSSNPLKELQRIGAGRSNQLSKSPSKKESTWLHFFNKNCCHQILIRFYYTGWASSGSGPSYWWVGPSQEAGLRLN